MEKKAKKTIATILLSVVIISLAIGVVCSSFVNRTKIENLNCSSAVLNNESSSYAGIEDVVDGVWKVCDGRTINYYFRADDGAFWTKDHLEYKLTLSEVMPDLVMRITYIDSKNGNQQKTIDYSLDKKTYYEGEDKSVTWNQVQTISVELILSNDSIRFNLHIRHD